ncbi:hypothetical protein BJ138DRAFT_1144264 [Hygrophoropsis aurantiaca]|uniref:Uncharacterized protein n=1 Tax=Hygrophoropsis aurantiaca TaxID=72124 RepID=A0ACB8AMR4_9AGAM|nr:hypothetical protein BJ138DRAFT_1144264 [Hygrophoropsis aurantiaca]
MMPRELPGLYWDEDRQRYFPVSSKPKIVEKPRPTVSLPAKGVPRASRKNGFDSPGSRGLRSSRYFAQKDGILHRILCSQIASTSKSTRYTLPTLHGGSLTAFQTTTYNGCMWSFAGDSSGWFYSSLIDSERESLGFHTSHGWRADFNLSSEISSICISGSLCIVTSFGPESKILHFPLDSESQAIHVIRINPHAAHDVWTSDLRGSRLVLGANKQALVFRNGGQSRFEGLKTQSDVFAVTQDENAVYTGSRGGSILRFDMRLAGTKGQEILGDTFTSKTNSVTNLKLLRDWQLLVANIDGSIATFDMRYLQARTPILTCFGHVNSYTTKTPLVIDTSEDFVFAAGQDRQVKVWSLRAGGSPLHYDRSPFPIFPPSPRNSNPFGIPFEHPINALQVSEDKDGVSLWVTSHMNLHKYDLGQRGVAL